jgi:hypothetical protein
MAIDSGELESNLDPRDFVFDFMAIVLMTFRCEPLLGLPETQARARAAFERLIQRHKNPSTR